VIGDGKEPGSNLTIKSLQIIINANKNALVTHDALGQTPVRVLIKAKFERNAMKLLRYSILRRQEPPTLNN
jgi:hypothetical protein